MEINASSNVKVVQEQTQNKFSRCFCRYWEFDHRFFYLFFVRYVMAMDYPSLRFKLSYLSTFL